MLSTTCDKWFDNRRKCPRLSSKDFSWQTWWSGCYSSLTNHWKNWHSRDMFSGHWISTDKLHWRRHQSCYLSDKRQWLRDSKYCRTWTPVSTCFCYTFCGNNVYFMSLELSFRQLRQVQVVDVMKALSFTFTLPIQAIITKIVNSLFLSVTVMSGKPTLFDYLSRKLIHHLRSCWRLSRTGNPVLWIPHHPWNWSL